ncbi:GIY-YIG nuclease family protein [Jannaschia sp. 2305UL9-9]|uniref:GIY-YIG nuclease family protein n=1 Tax=Jannaschia sp. 2305UL9-9 TaxID=3121638 RepID=UPI003527799B
MTDAPSRGRSLELYFADGTPDGILTAEVFGWTGHILRIPRLRLADGLRRREAAHTGTYLLLGEQDDRPRAYVGEAESVVQRIRSHDAQKDWWREALILTTAADNLHKAHVRYLEARLVQLARVAGNADLDNGNDPVPASLTEAQRANMEEFLDTLQMVLPALGVDLLATARRTPAKTPPPETPIFTLRSAKGGVACSARLDGSRLVVLEGSQGRVEWVTHGGQDHGYKALRARLLDDGVLRQSESHAIFTQDYAFNSPSAAAAVCTGRAANGRLEWRTETTNKTLADWEADQLKDLDT